MRSLISSLIGWMAFGVCCLPSFADEQPNVLFIAVDDLRDWVGHLGGHPNATLALYPVPRRRAGAL
jgi:hypothetical protein